MLVLVFCLAQWTGRLYGPQSKEKGNHHLTTKAENQHHIMKACVKQLKGSKAQKKEKPRLLGVTIEAPLSRKIQVNLTWLHMYMEGFLFPTGRHIGGAKVR